MSKSEKFVTFNIELSNEMDVTQGPWFCLGYPGRYRGSVIRTKSFLEFFEAIRIYYSLHFYFCLNCFWKICYAIMGFLICANWMPHQSSHSRPWYCFKLYFPVRAALIPFIGRIGLSEVHQIKFIFNYAKRWWFQERMRPRAIGSRRKIFQSYERLQKHCI